MMDGNTTTYYRQRRYSSYPHTFTFDAGEMTTVSPCVFLPSIKAGSWKVRLFPPPVGNIVNNDSPRRVDSTACCCMGIPSKMRNSS